MAVRGEQGKRQFNDERITRGQVGRRELKRLELTLIELYLKRAKDQGMKVECLADAGEYDKLEKAGKLFDGTAFYMLFDADLKVLLDFRPVVFHLLDTEEGLFYAKCESSRPAGNGYALPGKKMSKRKGKR